jgi:hypothetical protein
MTKERLFSLVRDEHVKWWEAIRRLNQAQMVMLRFPDGRTPKDVVAHVTWYEKQIVGVLKARALVGSELWDVSLEERNAAIHEENKDRPLVDVLAESKRVFAELVSLIRSLSDADLHDPSRFPGMPADWRPWKLIAENTFEHYRGHLEELEGVLGGAPGPAAG